MRLSPQQIAAAAQGETSDDCRIDPAQLADLPAILTIGRACFAYDVPERANLRYMLTRAHAAFYVARAKGEIVAYGYAEANARHRILYVNTVAVAPDARGRGIARALYRAFIRLRDLAGYAALTAHVETDNEPAIRLMQSLDFVTVERIDNYYHDNGLAALKMRLASPPSLRA